MSSLVKRALPLAVLAILAGLAFVFDVHHYLTLSTLRDNRLFLENLVMENTILMGLAFMATYAAVVTLSLPGATIMTLSGGFLFGAALGGTLTVIGATMGAIAIFLVARTAIGGGLHRRAGPFLSRMETGFRENAFNYLLFLRLVPAFPFWAVNLVPALAGVPLATFFFATAFGIIPGTFVYAAFGASIGDLFNAGTEIQLTQILSPTLLGAFIGLGGLALLPVVIKKWRAQ